MAGGAGTLDLDEIAVISHSAVTQTIELWALEGDPVAARADLRQLVGGSSGPELSLAALAAPRFCQRWRDFAHTSRRTLAKGVSNMRIGQSSMGGDGPPPLEISLTWAGDTSDGPDKASVLIDVDSRQGRGPAQE